MRIILFTFCVAFLVSCDKKEIEYTQENGFRFETEKVNGLREGIQKVYYPSGELQATRSFQNDTLNGLSSYFGKSGRLSKKFTYKNGKKNGLYELYYLNGNIAETGVFVENYIHGKMLQFFETDSGEVKNERYSLDFENNLNEVQYFISYDSNGNVLEAKESLKILLPNELEHNKLYEIQFEFCEDYKNYPYDSAIVILGNYENDFKGESDTIEFTNKKALFQFSSEHRGVELIRGKWLIYKKTQDADSIYEYTTSGFFEKPIMIN